MNKFSTIIKYSFLVLLMPVSWSASAHEELSREYQIKAAYLLNFARFIYWQENFISTAENFNICVIGSNPFDESLNRLSNKKIKNRNIKINYSNSFIKEAKCKIVFISKEKDNNYKETLDKIGDSAVLTVSDIEGFSQYGGMIEFVRVKNKIKFEINLGRSNKSNIKYRSQLLEVAERLR